MLYRQVQVYSSCIRGVIEQVSSPSVGGVTVSIVAFQAIDPGSTPG